MIKLTGRQWIPAVCVLMMLALQGCTTTSAPLPSVGKPSLFPLNARPDPVCDGQDPRGPYNGACTRERHQELAFAALGKEAIFNMPGSGVCGEVSFDFGDSRPPQTFQNVSFSQGQVWQLRTTYAGWPGKKLVRVKGLRDCLADTRTEILVGFEPDGRDDVRAAFLPQGTQCAPVLAGSPRRAMPPIRNGSTVRIVTDGGKINYGANAIFDASGDPSASVPPGYLFPGHRKHSLVYRIGGQEIQGEAGPVIFRANNTAPLEICVNDNPAYLADNTGGMVITITVNESSAP